jgi:hypothetical protein
MNPDINNYTDVMLYNKFKGLTHPVRQKLRIEFVAMLKRLEAAELRSCMATQDDMETCEKWRKSVHGCSSCNDNVNRYNIKFEKL